MNKRELHNFHITANRLDISTDALHTFRLASKRLRNWFEKECGDGNEYASWCIERDEKTDKPYMVTYPHNGKERRRAIPDMEKGARKRIAALCKELGLCHYIQTDCRGLALYLSREELNDRNYNSKGQGVG